MLSADSRINAGETASRMIRRLFANDVATNNVGGLASNFASRLQGGRSVTDLSGAGPYYFWPYPQYTSVNVIDSNDFSTYHGLELLVERRFSSNLFANVNYTFSKSLDNRSFDPNFTVVATANATSASSTPFSNNNRKLNYGRSDFDRTHQFKSTVVYDLPFGKGQRFAHSFGRAFDMIAGGWRASGILSLTSGRPFTVYSGSNTSSNIVQSLADCNGCTRKDGAALHDEALGFMFQFDAAQRAKFSIPAAGAIGNTARNFFETARSFNLNANLAKHIKLTERYNLELRLDATNFTNTPTFAAPTATFTSPLFGRIGGSIASSSRRMQIGSRFYF